MALSNLQPTRTSYNVALSLHTLTGEIRVACESLWRWYINTKYCVSGRFLSPCFCLEHNVLETESGCGLNKKQADG
jgi:hypothetical protein